MSQSTSLDGECGLVSDVECSLVSGVECSLVSDVECSLVSVADNQTELCDLTKCLFHNWTTMFSILFGRMFDLIYDPV